jgi:hypothetical protein
MKSETDKIESLNSIDLSIYSNEELREIIAKADAVIDANPLRDYQKAEVTFTMYFAPGEEVYLNEPYIEILYNGNIVSEESEVSTAENSLAFIPISSMRVDTAPHITPDWVKEAIAKVLETVNQ